MYKSQAQFRGPTISDDYILMIIFNVFKQTDLHIYILSNNFLFQTSLYFYFKEINYDLIKNGINFAHLLH